MYIIEYRTASGRLRYASVADAGDNGYSCADAPGAGTHTYQSRSLRDVLRFSICHSAWRTYASRRGIVAALGGRGEELRQVVLYGAPAWAPRAWKME